MQKTAQTIRCIIKVRNQTAHNQTVHNTNHFDMLVFMPRFSHYGVGIVFMVVSSSCLAQVCTREYQPLCGQVAGQAAPATFANRCLLKAAQAKPLHEGECAPPTTQPPKLVGSDLDVHGCRPSAGFEWNPELARCIQPWITQVVTLQVAALRQKCMGLFEQQCLMVREIEAGQTGTKPPPYTPLFNAIAGYSHRKGRSATLRVRKDRTDNPPADASDTSYTLLRVLR